MLKLYSIPLTAETRRRRG